MSTTDRAAAIRAALKAKGWSTRKVSVRSHYYSMGSSIYVTVKDPDIPLTEVSAIAEPHERIDRCAYSGEILSGGNRYVSTSYSSEAEAAIRARHAVLLDATAEALKAESDRALLPLGETGLLMGKTGNGFGFTLWGDSYITTGYQPVDLALALHHHARVS